MQEVGLIRRKQWQGSVQYEICKEGLALLRTLRTKKLRIIFNITHDRSDLSQFNHSLLGMQHHSLKQRPDACLTISRRPGELQGGRVILLLNAYEQPQGEPAMVILGYLAASVFLYHHQGKLDEGSALTVMLAKLKQLLAATDVHHLTEEMTYKKGYSKQPHFLCLLPAPTTENAFRDYYRYTTGKDFFNDAVDALIDFLPERSSLAFPTTPQQLRQIGRQFQEKVLGRQIFNFQFTGSTIENLCFQCCEAFNAGKALNLSLVYAKVIDNQKARLEDQAKERYLAAITALFEGSLPLASHLLLQRHNELADAVLEDALQCASYCMSLPQYQSLQHALRDRFKQGLADLQAANLQKIEQSCRECFSILSGGIQETQMDSQALSQTFRTVSNKLELFLSECSKNYENDPSFRIFQQYLSRIQTELLGKLGNVAVQTAERLELMIQECRVEAQGLKYRLRVQEGLNRELQYQYNLQYSILSDFKLKVAPTPSPPAPPAFSLDLNKARKRIQELQEEVQDRALHIEELQGVIERFEGLGQREKLKYKFSRELTEMASDVTKQFNECHGFLRQVKKINELQEEIKQGFAKEKQNLIEERRKGLIQLATREAQFQKVVKEKTLLQEVIGQAKQSIQVYKQVDQHYKQSISHLQNTYTQAQCLLADTENDLQLFKKALALTAEQQIRGSRLESLNKFYRVCSNPQLKQLLKPFLRR